MTRCCSLWRGWSIERTRATKIRHKFAIWSYTPMSLTQLLLAIVQLKLNLTKGSGIWSCVCYMYLAELDRLQHWGAGGEQMYRKRRRSACIKTFVKILKVNCYILPLACNGTDNFAGFFEAAKIPFNRWVSYRVRLSILAWNILANKNQSKLH